MTATTAEAIATHLQELLRNPDAIGLVDWLAMTRWAETHESIWIDALRMLSREEYYELFESLRRDDAGPFAGSLLMLTARHANDLPYADVRDLLLQDAITASDRRIAMITERHDNLAKQVDGMQSRQRGEAELETEITRLEQRRNELWLGETGRNYERVHEIEQEIIRLEAFEGTLRTWAKAEDSRLSMLSDLTTETERLRRRKDVVEGEIAEAIAKRDTLQRKLDDSEKRKRKAEEGARALEDSESKAKAEFEQAREKRDAAQARVDEINQQISTVNRAHDELLRAEAKAETRRRELIELLTSQYAPSRFDQQATAEPAMPVEGSPPTHTDSPHSDPSHSPTGVLNRMSWPW